jgi:ureidoglycolate hydrolase
MANDIMTITGRTDPGYGICVDSAESWIVAVNNAGPDSTQENITFFGAHPNTDEVFILVTGKACIAVAPHDSPEEFSVTGMEQGIFYNVRRNTWHTVMMAQGGKVAICENRNPESGRHDLSDEARERLVGEANKLLQ